MGGLCVSNTPPPPRLHGLSIKYAKLGQFITRRDFKVALSYTFSTTIVHVHGRYPEILMGGGGGLTQVGAGQNGDKQNTSLHLGAAIPQEKEIWIKFYPN